MSMLTVNDTHQLFNELQKELGRAIGHIQALDQSGGEGVKLTPEEIAGRLQKCRGMIFHLLRSYDHMVDIAMGVEAPPKPEILRRDKLRK
jgi:hypothetical protein